ELLQGKCEIGEALGRFHDGQMAVIASGKTPVEPAALLASPRFVAALQTLRSLFDEIVLDVPPALATADASILAHRADGVVMGVRAEATPREQVASAVRALSGAPVRGVVLNAGNGRALAALIGAAACIPAALYLADLYDPQVMRNDRARGSATLKALGFAAVFAAIIGVLGGSGLPKGALIGTFGVASLGVLLARAALVTRTDEDAHSRVLILGA